MEAIAKQFRKRNAILSCLRETKQHPSAEALYQSLHRDHPDISLATVYRNLALFKSQGLIQSLGTVNGMERFDGDTSPHVHFICTHCGAVLDMPGSDAPVASFEQAAHDLGCRIEGCQLMFTGTCQDCLRSE